MEGDELADMLKLSRTLLCAVRHLPTEATATFYHAKICRCLPLAGVVVVVPGAQTSPSFSF